MRFEQFRTKVRTLPVISGDFLKLLSDKNQQFKNQITRWQKSGKIIKLRRNLYILNEDERKINPSRLFIACELYSPSYVSMEYALSFYGLIPERVADITSITTKKTAAFENALGRFIYQHIKIKCFAGFTELKDEAGLAYYMATPEKAIVDFIYLNQSRFKEDFRQELFGSFRFQNTKILNAKKMIYYSELFGSKKLKAILKQVK